MRIVALVAAILLGAASTPTLAQRAPDPIPIEEWSLEKVSAMGAAIYRQDVAAWVATDAVLDHLAGAPPPPGTVGWIVLDEGEAQRVRFVREAGGTMKAVFDIVVRDGRAGEVEVVDEALSDEENAHFRARQTAIDNAGDLRCSPRLNPVVLRDPDGDGWLVWLLTPTPDSGDIPIGGHYRFRISADGGAVLRRDQLSNGCFFAPPPEGEVEDVLLFFTQIVSKGPVETMVFLSIQHQTAIIISAGDRFFAIEGTAISDVTDMIGDP